MKSRRVILIWVALIIAVFALLIFRQQSKQEEPEYRTVTTERAPITVTVLATGTVQPENRVEVKPSIAGRAERVLVREGDRVEKGQTLVWMSSTERAALMDAARARGPRELKRWEELYRATPILAPITGTIILRNIEPGQTFATTDSILVMSDRLTVQAQVDETDIAQIQNNQKASIVLDAYPQQEIPGRVEEIAYEAQTVSNVTTYQVTVVPVKVPDFMRSGMTANVSFQTAAKDNALLIPAEALKTKGDETYVLTPSPEGAPSETVVKTGLSDGKRVEVISGLQEGDQILIQEPDLTANGRTSGTNPFSPMGRRQRR